MNESEIRAVRQSWELVAADLEGNGVALFKKVFEIAPKALQLFSIKDEPNLYDSNVFKTHATKVMYTVGTAVARLVDYDSLVTLLVQLGERHAAYNLLPAHYDVVGTALLTILEEKLGSSFTPEVQESWMTVWGVVKVMMLQAAEAYTKSKKDVNEAKR